MSPAAAAKSADSDADDVLPSSGVRTALSLLLVVHFLALFVAVASNAGYVSPLRRAFRNVPGVVTYLQSLHMDLAYNYHLTYGESIDTDHFAQVEVNWKGKSSPEATLLELPDVSIQPGIRRGRYFNLTRAMSSRSEVEEIAGLLPLAIAQRLLVENDVADGTHRFRCRRHYMLDTVDVGSTNPADRDPEDPSRFDTIYEANLFFAGDELNLIKATGAGQAAQVKRASGRERTAVEDAVPATSNK